MTLDPGFVMTPLGPRTDQDGRWCCGLHCTGRQPGVPCPYQLRLRPSTSAGDADDPGHVDQVDP